MFGTNTIGRGVLLGFTAFSLISCDQLGGSSGQGGSSESQLQIDPAALKSAATDPEVRKFYEANGWNAVWDRRREEALVQALDGALSHGLAKSMFLKDQLPADAAQRETALTKAALAYASALARGHVDPTKIFEVNTLGRPNPDLPGGLAQAASQNQLGEWLQSLAPQTPEYKALSEAFLRYAKQMENGEVRSIPPGEPIKPGDSDPRIPQIAQTLAANGYLTPAEQPEQPQQQQRGSGTQQAETAQQAQSQTYTPELAQAVQRFQAELGMKTDGIIGNNTLEALNTGAKDRARQLLVNLERLRWLDRDPPPTRIDVNTAATFLEYFHDGQLRDSRRVVVGEPGWETPELRSPIFRLVANPTWTVPESIVEDELAGKSAAYFRAQNFIRKDGFYVQQPGPKNALGQVKFDMQNDHAIYLHDTPAKAFFAEEERHRSHGCVRVHNAVQFAHVIAQAAGVLPQFQEALASGDETFVPLETKIPVRLLYQTAFFRDGKVQFREDVYGWDDKVALALGGRPREARALRKHQRGSDIGP